MTYREWSQRAYLVIGVTSGTYAALWGLWVAKNVSRARQLFARPDDETTEEEDE